MFTTKLSEQDILVQKMTENLPVLRKKLKLTQEELAVIIGSSRHTVMQIESGKRKMTWSTFLSLVLLFEKNESTAMLLRAFEVYTPGLENILTR